MEEVGFMIPTFEDFMLPMLQFLGDGREHSMEEVENYLANYFDITDAERLQKYETGRFCMCAAVARPKAN